MRPSLQVAHIGCGGLAQADPQALGLTYWFDAKPSGTPYPVTVRFTGHWSGVDGPPTGPDHFTASETFPVVPGSGRIAVTTRILDIAPGAWRVTARPVAASRPGQARRPAGPAPRAGAWACGRTGFTPIVQARAPGVRLGAWPAATGTGVVIALAVQAALARRAGLPLQPILLLSLAACVLGLLGSKLLYLALEEPRAVPNPRAVLGAGMCIQGFVMATLATAAIGGPIAGIPVSRFLDVTAPGLLFGMAIGRLGCFFGGCCAGRPTASRWGLWSSDRHLGMRRIPVQLLESALALTLGSAALSGVLIHVFSPPGLFVGSMAAYTLGRQLLLPLRDIPRRSAHGRRLVLGLSALVLLGDLLVATVA